MYSRPSASVIVAPFADWMKSGVPPTPRNARTGLFTPPGMICLARSNRAEESGYLLFIGRDSPVTLVFALQSAIDFWISLKLSGGQCSDARGWFQAFGAHHRALRAVL